MSQFLRDEIIRNINIDENALEIINQYFIDKARKTNDILGDIPSNEHKLLFPSYVIRFDKKGYRFFSFHEVINHYNQASKVGRIIYTLETGESIRSSRNMGSYLELRLDAEDSNNCYLVASSDDENWVDLVFTGIQDIINKFHNKSRFFQNTWTILSLQMFGVMIGFVISLWASIRISPYLSLENAFIICFLFIFILFSNLWTFLNRLIIKLLNYSFPVLRFVHKKKETIHWLIQSLVGGIILAVALFILNKIFDFVGSAIGSFIK